MIHIFTHDSIGLGEDGPTHQPVEQLASLRAIPGLIVIRPCDANEVAEAWRVAIDRTHGPVALVLTRQNVPVLDRSMLRLGRGPAPRRLRARRRRRRRPGGDPDRDRQRGRARGRGAREAGRRRGRLAGRQPALVPPLRPPGPGVPRQRAAARRSPPGSRSRRPRPSAGTATSARRGRRSACTRSAPRRRSRTCSTSSGSRPEKVVEAARNLLDGKEDADEANPATSRPRPEPLGRQHHPDDARRRHAGRLHRRLLGHRADLEPDDLRQGDRRRRAPTTSRSPSSREQGLEGEELFFELALTDLRRAAALFKEVHERTTIDGRVSLEVSPKLADDAAGDDQAGGRALRPRRGELLHQDPRHRGRAQGDRGDDLRRDPGQRDAAVRPRAVPRRRRRVHARARAAGRGRA